MRFEDKTKEYNEGYEAYLRGDNPQTNPYKSDYYAAFSDADKSQMKELYRTKFVDWYSGFVAAKVCIA